MLPRTERGNRRRDMNLRRKRLSAFLCMSECEAYPEKGTLTEKADSTMLNMDKKLDPEESMEETLAKRRELVMGEITGHQQSK